MEPSHTASREYSPTADHSGDRPHPGTPEDLATELAELAAEAAPSRFTLCLIDDEQLDAAIIGWGLALINGMLVYLPYAQDSGTRHTVRTFSSVEQMRRRLCRDDNTRLIWNDPEPTPIAAAHERAEPHDENISAGAATG